MTTFFKFFAVSNLHIAFASTFLYLYYALNSHSNFFISTIFLVFGSTYIGYHLLRLIPWKLRSQYIGHENIRFYNRYKYFTALSILISLLFILYGLVNFNQAQFIVLFIILLLGGLYEKILFKSFALRELPYTKAIIIALTWSLTCTGLIEHPSVSAFIDCFFFIIFLSIPFDIKDIKQDTLDGIKTFATYSISKTKLICAIGYTLLSVFWIYKENDLFYMISLPLYLIFLKKGFKTEASYYMSFDSLIILRALIYFFQH